MVRIGKIRNINIYSDSDGHYIVHNTSKEFEVGHTHISNYKTAKYVAYLVAYNKIPKRGHLSDYLYESIYRLSKNREYIKRLRIMQSMERDKRQKNTDGRDGE